MRITAASPKREAFAAGPVSVMCRVFRVSVAKPQVCAVAGYYAWRARPESGRAAENKVLLEDIREVHAASQGRRGSETARYRWRSR